MPGTASRCVLTGSSSGIGLALARRLLAEGWDVLGIDRQPAPADMPAGFRGLVRDLAADEAVEQEAGLADWLGDSEVTAFVHSAGVVRSGGTTDTLSSDADALYRIHVAAPIRLMRSISGRLPRARGRVVLVSSRAVLGPPNRAPYAASKAAQIGLARSWAAELIGRGITVNVVAPGAVDTPQLRDPQRGAPPRITLPIGRLITAEEVSATIAFFISAEAGAITGQTLYVCGGASLHTAHG